MRACFAAFPLVIEYDMCGITGILDFVHGGRGDLIDRFTDAVGPGYCAAWGRALPGGHLDRGIDPPSVAELSARIIREFAGFTPKDTLFMSDIPWAVAWYGPRECLWATLRVVDDPEANINNRREDFFVFTEARRPIRAVYLLSLIHI